MLKFKDENTQITLKGDYLVMETIAQILETVMLICFGFSWPMNLIKAYRSRTAKSTSLIFILLIITGYVAGIIAKFIKIKTTAWYLIAVYCFNLVVVSLNLVVYFRNKALDKKAGLDK